MKSVVETLNPTRVKLLVEVPFAELRPSLDSAYRKIAQQVVVPGFRKGKVPNLIIDQRIGRGVVLEEAVNEALPKFYSQAVQANDLQPLGQPQVDLDEITDGTDLKFTAEVDVRPKVELPEWEGISVEVADAVPTVEEIDEQLEGLRKRFGTLTSVDRVAGDGDFVTVDLSATQDDEPVEGAEASGMSYQIGTNEMLEGLDEALVGMSPGDSKTFQSTLHGEREGLEVEVTVTVQGVKEQQLPDLDDDFAQMASEFDTIDELRDDVRERAVRYKRIQQASEAQQKVLSALLDKVDVPLPEGVIESQIQDHFQDGHGDDDHRAEFEQEVRRNMKAQFILDELVKAEALSVSQEELTSYLLQTAARSGIDPNQYAQQAVQAGVVPAMVADVARGKALALVVERATVVDASGRPVELDRLREDGTLATDEELDEDEDVEGYEDVEEYDYDGHDVDEEDGLDEDVESAKGEAEESTER